MNRPFLWIDFWSSRDYRQRHCGASERKAIFAPSIFVGDFTCFGQRSLDLMPELSQASFRSRAPGLHDQRRNPVRIQWPSVDLSVFGAPLGSLLRKPQTLIHPCRRARISRVRPTDGPSGLVHYAFRLERAWLITPRISRPIDNRGHMGHSLTGLIRRDHSHASLLNTPKQQKIPLTMVVDNTATILGHYARVAGLTWVDLQGSAISHPPTSQSFARANAGVCGRLAKLAAL